MKGRVLLVGGGRDTGKTADKGRVEGIWRRRRDREVDRVAVTPWTPVEKMRRRERWRSKEEREGGRWEERKEGRGRQGRRRRGREGRREADREAGRDEGWKGREEERNQ